MGGITMVAAAILLLVFAALFFAIGGSIYGGNTNLIISYHQEKVKPEERKAYGKAFGKTILVLASALAISGIILFFGDAMAVKIASLCVFAVGCVLFAVLLAVVQKKYNGGMF